jgi:hypothetical protein
MLKIRNLILALSFSPLMFVSWQLPNQAQTNSPSKGPAGTPSGANPGGSTGTIFTSPPRGGAGGGDAGRGNNTGGVPVPTSASLSVGADGTIAATPAAAAAVSSAAVAAVQSAAAGGGGDATAAAILGGGAGGQAAAAEVAASLGAAGVDPALGGALTEALGGIVESPSGSIPSSFPSAQLPQEQLVASNKALKASLIIAQGAAPTVNINKLSDAINAYNQIVETSSPVTLQKISQNKDFVAIGTLLKKLRAAIG